MTRQSIATTEAQENTAWVTLAVPVSPDRLFDFLQNTERLFRLNPYLDISKWEELSAEKRFHLEALNEMNGVTYDLLIGIESDEPGARIRLSYQSYNDAGLKLATEITLKPSADGSALTLCDHYTEPKGENREKQLKEVDHGLTHWAVSIRRYLLGLERWGWFWPYRWYLESFWLSMRPTHRRIVRMLIWITSLEFVVFLFVFTIYWLEFLRT